jgi:hypothetical protein
MFNASKFAAVAAIPALALMAAPAQARDGNYRGNRGGDDAAIAIGAGVVGLALGAAIASGNRDRDYYYDDGYSYPRGSYYPAYPRYYSYRYDYPRYDRRWNGWRGNRHDGWGHHGGWGDRSGWGHGPRRWGY